MTVVLDIGGGQIVEFPDEATAQAFFANQQGGGQPAPAAPAPAGPNTGLAGQTASGFTTGLASMAGLPVDAMTSVVEGMQQRGQQYRSTGIDPETGAPNPIVMADDYQPFQIDNPVGGSQFNVNAMDPFIANDAPDTTAERYGFSIGRDLGASAPFAAAALPAMGANAGRYLGLEALSSVGSGAGEQAAEDAGGNEAVQMIASLLGGAAPVAAAYRMQPPPTGETVESLGARRDADYGAVRASTASLPPASRDGMLATLRNELSDDFDEVLHPRAARALERADAFPDSPTISDIDRLRRFVRDNVSGSPDASEARIGQRMVASIDDQLQHMADSGQLGPDATETVNRLLSGRDAHSRIARAEAIVGDTGALTRAERRAATSGTGGNVINAMRQNVRAILDNPSRRQGYTPDEIAAMERVVAGGAGEDLARLVGRLSPQGGALPLMGNMGALAFGASMGPGGAIGAMAPGVVGMTAQAVGENMTRRNIDRVVETILNGQPLPGRSVTPEQTAVIQALLGSQAGLTSAQMQ